MVCGHCIIGVICRVLRLGSCEFSSVEEDELAIFLLPMPVSLPGEKVGVYASFRTISFSFKAVRSEYLSRTQWLRKGRPFCLFCTRHKFAPWPKTTYGTYICYAQSTDSGNPRIGLRKPWIYALRNNPWIDCAILGSPNEVRRVWI